MVGALPGYFMQRLGPALGALLEAATATGEIRADISAKDLLHAVAHLCLPVADQGVADSQRMVALLVDGLRYGGNPGALTATATREPNRMYSTALRRLLTASRRPELLFHHPLHAHAV